MPILTVQKSAKPVLTSMLFERLAYFGFRSVIVLYLIKALGFEDVEAMMLYGYATGFGSIAEILGGLIGDLFMKGKRSIIVGGLIQTLSPIVLLLPIPFSSYISIALLVLGGGLYSPHVNAIYVKEVIAKAPELLDSHIMISYTIIQLGAFLGTTLLTLIFGERNWLLLFIGFAVFFLLSVISILRFNEPELEDVNRNIIADSNKPKYLSVVILVVLIGLFLLSEHLQIIRPHSKPLDLISNALSILAVISTIFLWQRRPSNVQSKLLTGASALALATLFYFFFFGNTRLELLPLLLLAISSAFMVPILIMVTVRIVPLKFLATWISLMRWLVFGISSMGAALYYLPSNELDGLHPFLPIFSLLLLAFAFWTNKK